MTFWSKDSEEVFIDEEEEVKPSSRQRKQPSLKARAVQYLARREYSRLELRGKLLRYLQPEQEEAEVDRLLDELEGLKYLSDERYAKSRARIRSNKYGNARIEFELRRQGLEEDIVKEAMEPLESEAERARALWLRRFKGKTPEDFKEKTKQIRYLAGRGFSFDVIQKVINTDIEDWEE